MQVVDTLTYLKSQDDAQIPGRHVFHAVLYLVGQSVRVAAPRTERTVGNRFFGLQRQLDVIGARIKRDAMRSTTIG